ncbi:M14 family zinc carboxypeptidase [Micromonospora zamorensis]|uniref:M14 family zinc carboxypeptidase n=1 Tax=Micromonospora zamorensis TaxID=709883 RepID=UPI0033EB80AF
MGPQPDFSVGSVFDGYVGASATNCISDTFAGPAELSEPEARNEVWLVGTFPNIKLSMNTHSYGGYFMWPPGAYKAEGREVLPWVDQGTEAYFWTSSDYILSRVQEYRGTAIWPGRTGPVTDVLYSAADNSADEHWYNRGIIGWDFEVGADVYNPTTGGSTRSVSSLRSPRGMRRRWSSPMATSRSSRWPGRTRRTRSSPGRR